MKSSALRKLDVVQGCFHSALRITEDQTGRYLAGLRNPDIQILGHPQTRVYDKREGLKADWHRVFAEAAKLDRAVDIDGYTDRQDLRVSLLKKARKEGADLAGNSCSRSIPARLHGNELGGSLVGENPSRELFEIHAAL